ncbi:MAG TPA: acylphosphatase [Stellaceae bacterium]|nr:acylphosphatase [Stellaceae bacterium]
MRQGPAKTARLRITGRVQGVGFRAWAMREAGRRGLRGWVRNRLDGSVEILVSGTDADVASMVEACRGGPFAAQVERVLATEDDDDGSPGFSARPTG